MAIRAAGEMTAVNDRYRIERVLGQGGMGEVLAVLEPATGKHFALKRLLPGAKARRTTRFSREFHTLASLKHPHIVRAFDYGTCDGVPYYTMELLSGSDLESLAPLPWTDVVLILRDVGAALSLLHARHLVHRDVGARNVWRMPDGMVKLIDFGAMTSFGASGDIAGTSPYVAPEAVRTRVLDQRTDLFSLGALGYFLLTGCHAYPAHAIAELERHWAEPLRSLRVRVAELQRADLPAPPEALEQLIEALLAMAPEARPASAAEVLDRLDHVLPSRRAVSDVALDSVLASKAFVGRENERKRFAVLLKRARSNHGASLALVGPRGVGRSRLLSELAVDARVAGAAVISVAGDGERGTLAVAARAALKLLEALPGVAVRCAAPHASVLGHLSEELREALGVEREALECFPELLGEARVRMQSALHAFWLAVTDHKPVVLLLDDLQSMDEASIALFTTLARDAAQTQLVVVAAVRSELDASVSAPAQAFVEKALVLSLAGLLPDEYEKMLRSIFGDAEHLSRMAQHLADKAEGYPGRMMELCEYLVHSGKVRCIDGVWVLPQELSELVTPASLAELDLARFSRVSEHAKQLARRLSVVEGALPLELCSALSPLPPEAMFAALDELCACRVLVHGEHGYSFRSEPLRASLAEALDQQEAQRACTAAGEALLGLEAASLAQRLTAGVYLLRGGSPRRGVEAVYRAATDAVLQMPEERTEIAQRLEQGFAHIRKLALRDDENMAFLCVLAWCGYFVDRRLGFTYGDEALACAQRVCGMDLARRLSHWLGKKLGLYVALFITSIRLRRRARRGALVPDLKLALRLFLSAAGALAGMYTLCVARDKVLASAKAMEPLTALGPDHSANALHRFADGCAGTVSDHLGEARRHWEQLIARLEDPRPIQGLEGEARSYRIAASMYAWAGSECWRDNSRALEIADRLERQPLKLYQVSADQLRAQYYAHQGNVAEAARHKARLEMRALQRGMTWQVEIWAPSSAITVAFRQHDAIALKRASGQLSHLTADTPSLRDHVANARASYLVLRGRYGEALDILEPLVARHDPELIGHANLVGLLAQAYNALHRFADAERVASQALARLTPEDLAYPAMTLRVQIELALAQAGLGQLEQAAAQLDALIALHTPNEGPLTLGALHDARASVALRAGQEDVARHHVAAMERWYRSTDCPGLIQHCDRLAKRWAKGQAGANATPFTPSMSFLASISGRLTSGVVQDSPEELVAQLVRGAMANEGVLYYFGPDGQRCLVRSRPEELPEGLSAWVEERVHQGLSYSTETEESDGEPADANVLSFAGNTWRLFLLVSDQTGSDAVVGALALCNPLSQVPLEVLRSLAQHLHMQSEAKPVLPPHWA